MDSGDICPFKVQWRVNGADDRWRQYGGYTNIIDAERYYRAQSRVYGAVLEYRVFNTKTNTTLMSTRADD